MKCIHNRKPFGLVFRQLAANLQQQVDTVMIGIMDCDAVQFFYEQPLLLDDVFFGLQEKLTVYPFFMQAGPLLDPKAQYTNFIRVDRVESRGSGCGMRLPVFGTAQSEDDKLGQLHVGLLGQIPGPDDLQRAHVLVGHL